MAMDLIEIARRYLEELLGQRQDIVAAWLGGSVARGQETAQSDIDLYLMVAGTGDLNRAGLDTWREGVYIEAALVSQQEYADPETVLNDPFKATHMNDALILYDPTGFVTHLQDAVRPVYMQPQWLGKRLAFWLENMDTSLARFRKQ
jgi:predicted nucleotidyltransferase